MNIQGGHHSRDLGVKGTNVLKKKYIYIILLDGVDNIYVAPDVVQWRSFVTIAVNL